MHHFFSKKLLKIAYLMKRHIRKAYKKAFTSSEILVLCRVLKRRLKAELRLNVMRYHPNNTTVLPYIKYYAEIYHCTDQRSKNLCN